MDEIEYEENLSVGKVQEVSATFSITLDYTAVIQELLDDGTLSSKKDIEDCVMELVISNIMSVFDQPYFAKRHTTIEIV